MNTPLLELTEVNESDFPSAADLNESLWALDAIIQLAVSDKDLVEPPATAVQGARYIVPSVGATGSWVNQGRRIAYLTPDGWRFRTPRAGWTAYVADEAAVYRYSGTAWEIDTAAGGGGSNAPRGATWVRSGSGAIVVPVNDVPLYFPEAMTILGVVILTRSSAGSCVIDIRKAAFGSYPPTSGDSICASAKPTISSGTVYLDSTLTGWTTAIAAGDTLLFVLESAATFNLIHCALLLEPA
jgi:hypothetical protein